jgi:uncharacterized protein (TIGR00369 family)
MSAVPAGFAVHDRRSPVTDAWWPLYSRTEAESITIGIIVAEQHCNGRGFLHGGVIATLADNAMGLSVHRAAQTRGQPIDNGALTLGLSVDYLSVAEQGSWIETRSRVHALGRSIGVVDCLIVDRAERVIARANASFRFKTARNEQTP